MKTIRQARYIDAAAVGSLQDALDLLPPEGGVIHVPAGEYCVDHTLRLALAEQQHLCLCGDGRASVIRFTATDGSALLALDGVPNSWWPELKITIRDLTFVGNHRSGDALFLRWPNDAMIDACAFQSFGGAAIVITPNATNVTIRDCWMRDCRRALHADNLHHLTFHGNQTRSVNQGGLRQAEHVYIGRHCREVRIVNNHLAYGHAEAIILDGTAQHVIANNTIEGFPVGIRALDCRDITINSNYIHCPVGIDMEGDNRGIIVSANIMTDTAQAAVRIRNAGTSGGHVLTGNIMRQSVYASGQAGVDLGDADACIVNGNLLEDLAAADGAGPLPPALTAADLGRHHLSHNHVANTAARAAQRLPANARVPGGTAEPGFAPLATHLASQESGICRLTLTFQQIERILGKALPQDAQRDATWWNNDPQTAQAKAWLGAGWLVAITKRIEGRVVFARIPALPIA